MWCRQNPRLTYVPGLKLTYVPGPYPGSWKLWAGSWPLGFSQFAFKKSHSSRNSGRSPPKRQKDNGQRPRRRPRLPEQAPPHEAWFGRDNATRN